MTGFGRIAPEAGYNIREINPAAKKPTATTSKFPKHNVDTTEQLPLRTRLPTLFLIALALTALVLFLRQPFLWQRVYTLPVDQDLGLL